MDRQLRELIERGIEALERDATAQEQILEFAKQEQFVIEHGPAVCCHCGKLNPEVTLLAPETGTAGPLDDFMMQVECHHCNKTAFVIAAGWHTFPSREVAADALNNLKGGK